METNKKKDKESADNKKQEKGYDVVHKEQVPEIPDPVINPPKEATDPAEIIKRA